MTIFNVTGGGGGGGDGSPTFKEMTSAPYSITASDWGDHYTQIPQYYFAYDNLLASITIPQGVTSIGGSAFYYCTSLASITIPQGVTSIGTFAFYYCTSLASITIPQGVTSIGGYAFSNCTSLASITIPQGVTSIVGSTFSNCTSLASITIPQGVTSIGSSAFGLIGTNTAGSVITMLDSTPPTLASNAFQSAHISKIIVPQGSLTAYQTATNWSAYAQYMEEAS